MFPVVVIGASKAVLVVNNLPTNAEDIRDVGLIPGKIPWRRNWQPNPLFFPGESSWTEELGRLQSIASRTVGHNWNNVACTQECSRHYIPMAHILYLTHLTTVLVRFSLTSESKKTFLCIYLSFLKVHVNFFLTTENVSLTQIFCSSQSNIL